MKKVLLGILFLTIWFNSFAQEKLFVCNRDIDASRKNPVVLSYGFQKGDKVIVTLSTKKDKTIEEVIFQQNGKNVFSKKDVDPKSPIEFTIPETNFVNFTFYGPTFGQNITVVIERIPASSEGRLFNTALQLYKKYDTTTVEYMIDSVVGLNPPEFSPKTFKIIKNVDFSSIKLIEKKHSINGGGVRDFMITKPQAKIETADSVMELKGYQIVITSKAGAQKMWDAIGTGIDIGTLALSLAFPVAGTVGGLGINTAFEMIGPQTGGEPVYFAITPNMIELNKFKSGKGYKAYENGLVTGYNCTYAPYDTLVFGFRNLNMATQIEISVCVYALYQKTTFTNIKENTVVVKPKTVKVARKQRIIKNNKTWGLQQ